MLHRIDVAVFNMPRPRRLDMVYKQTFLPFQQIDGKKPTSTGNERATIIGYPKIVDSSGGLRFANPAHGYYNL